MAIYRFNGFRCLQKILLIIQILHRLHNKSCYTLGSNSCEHIAISLYYKGAKAKICYYMVPTDIFFYLKLQNCITFNLQG